MMKRWLVTLLVLMLCMTILLSGCKTETEVEDSEKTATKTEEKKDDAKQETTPEPEEVNDPYMKFDPPITLTTGIKVLNSEAAWWNEEGPAGDNLLMRWSEDVIGIKWEASFVTATDDELRTQYNLAMASNDLPDLVNKATPDMIAKMAKGGQIIALDGLLEEWTSPLVKDILGQ